MDARRRVTADNIRWHVSDNEHIPVPDNSVDAIFSCQVFQHFPSNADQLGIFQEIHRTLVSGGTFFVHLPIHAFPYCHPAYTRAAQLLHRIFLRLYDARASIKRTMMRARGGEPYMHMVSYELNSLLADLSSIGFSDLNISLVKVRTGSTLHWCVSGRK
jgi:ubiquinone/menaquinone biosynthesis C-methylase UbiE